MLKNETATVPTMIFQG